MSDILSNNPFMERSLANELVAGILEAFDAKYNFEEHDVKKMKHVISSILEFTYKPGDGVAYNRPSSDPAEQDDNARSTISSEGTLVGDDADAGSVISSDSTCTLIGDDVEDKAPVAPQFNFTWYADTEKAKKFKALRKTKDGRWTPISSRTPSPTRVTKAYASAKSSPRARRSCSPSPMERALRTVEYVAQSIEEDITAASFDNNDASQVSLASQSTETTLVDDNFNVDPARMASRSVSPRLMLVPVPRRYSPSVSGRSGTPRCSPVSDHGSPSIGGRGTSPCYDPRLMEADGMGLPRYAIMPPSSVLGKRSASVESDDVVDGDGGWGTMVLYKRARH